MVGKSKFFMKKVFSVLIGVMAATALFAQNGVCEQPFRFGPYEPGPNTWSPTYVEGNGVYIFGTNTVEVTAQFNYSQISPGKYEVKVGPGTSCYQIVGYVVDDGWMYPINIIGDTDGDGNPEVYVSGGSGLVRIHLHIVAIKE